MRRSVLAVLALALSVLAACSSLRERPPAPTTPAGTWSVRGQDGDHWTARLVLHEGASTGFFDWRSTTGSSGHELLNWQYDPSTRMLLMTGQEMRDAVGPVGVGTYVARLAEDGRTIENGTWGPPARPGIWEATR